MSPRRILVTGGAGYVGSTLLVDLLARGYSVRALDSIAVGDGKSLLHLWGQDRFEFVHADVRDPDARMAALDGVWGVVHLAAVVGDPACSRDPERAKAVNLAATLSLLSESRERGAERFVFASTCSNYGKMVDSSEYATEACELRPVSLYAETKVAAETEVLSAAGNGFSTTCLRFATVYGVSSRMRFDLTVNEFARDALVNGELVVYGEQFWRPYVHVRDAAAAVVAVLESPPDVVRGEVLNVGNTAENYRKQDLVQILGERLPSTSIERVTQVDDPRDYRVSFDKIRSVLDFATKRKVSDGIDEVLALLRSGLIADPFAGAYRN